MNSIYIYHHLGLGDHIIANGLVRTIADNYDRVFLFCKPHNFKNVSFMYRDLSKLKIITMDYMGVREFMSLNPSNNYLIVGHKRFFELFGTTNLKIDEIFYQMANVPIENKWSRFFVNRDIEREKSVYGELGLKEGDRYIFLHDAETRKITKQIQDMKIITPNIHFSLFDLLYTIENAEEIHCINSSFYCLIDSIGIKKDKMFLHKYAIPGHSDRELGKYGSNWIIIN